VLWHCRFDDMKGIQHVTSTATTIPKSLLLESDLTRVNFRKMCQLNKNLSVCDLCCVHYSVDVLLCAAAFLTQTICLDDTVVKFEIWDTAGQERYHSLAPMYYRGAQAAIVMYDITNKVNSLFIYSLIDHPVWHLPSFYVSAIIRQCQRHYDFCPVADHDLSGPWGRFVLRAPLFHSITKKTIQ